MRRRPPDPPPDPLAGVELRPVTDADRPFLLAVYASTRADELAVVPWTNDEKAAFLAMQFDAQDRSYHQNWPDGRFLVIELGGTPIGRLYLGRTAGEIVVVDIALLPEHRGRGIGSALLADALAEADSDGLQVTLHVEPWNPAKRLYERLGFEVREVRGIYEWMVRPARGSGAPVS